MPFLIFLKSFEVLLYEVMSWLVFYPRTMWRAVRHPLQMMERTEDELKLAPAEQFRDVISPPIFLLLTVIAANSFEVAVVGNNALIDDGVGLAAMITDNSSLILFRLIVFASLPVVAGVLALAAMRRPGRPGHAAAGVLRAMFCDHSGGPAVQHCSDNYAIAATRREHPSGHHLRCGRPFLHHRRGELVCSRGKATPLGRRIMGARRVCDVGTGGRRDRFVVRRALKRGR